MTPIGVDRIRRDGLLGMQTWDRHVRGLLALKEAGTYMRKERDGLQLRHDKQLARLRFFEQALANIGQGKPK
jgi:hypothetical protein